MTVLIAEAYTPANIGDFELVERTYEVAERWHPGKKLTVLAVDVPGFAAAKPDWCVTQKLFPRLDIVHASRAGRATITVKWMLRALLLSLVTILPTRQARSVVVHASRLSLFGSTAGHYGRATHVLAVGGGYLGDQYKKDTLLTLWTWWWAGRLGVKVETMPISVEVHGKLLRAALKVLGRSVRWTVRDSASQLVLERAGQDSHLVPDLAFLNVGRLPRPAQDGIALVICPVGSDYLNRAESTRLQDHLCTAARAVLPSGSAVGLLSMHGRLGSTTVGSDGEAVAQLAERLSGDGFRPVVLSATTYAEVLDGVASADIVLSARMHAGIAGLCSSRKVGLLAYEEKHRALYRDMGLGEFVVDIDADAGVLSALLERLAANDSSRFVSAARVHSSSLRAWLGSE